MAFIHKSGPAATEPFLKVTSTAIAAGSVVSFFKKTAANDGRISQALVESTRIAGICIKKVASTDSDFADPTSIPVIIPGEEDVFEADAVGIATAAMVGRQFDLNSVAAGTAQSVDVAATTYKVVTMVGFISATKILVKFNGNYVYANKAN